MNFNLPFNHSGRDGMNCYAENMIFADGHGEWISNPHQRLQRHGDPTNGPFLSS